jgi:hypothetical protein
MSIDVDNNSDSVFDNYSDEDCINMVCSGMSPVDVLLSLAVECPRDCRLKSCPIKEVGIWRKMDLKEAYAHISKLPLSEQKILVEKHRKCSHMI